MRRRARNKIDFLRAAFIFGYNTRDSGLNAKLPEFLNLTLAQVVELPDRVFPGERINNGKTVG